MNIRNIILAFLIFPLNLFSQNYNYSFNNGLWGYDQIVCCSNVYIPTEIPSELYWQDSSVSVCIINDSISVSKSFNLSEQIIDCPYCSDFQVSWTTNEGYLISFEGYDYDDGRRIIYAVRIYYEGFQIGELNYPLIFR